MTAPTKPARKAPAPSTGPIRQLRLSSASRRRRAAAAETVNPLREGLRLERMPDPCMVVLFGATGDLSHRKVVPALFQLWRSNLLPHEFRLVAVARRSYDDATFRREMRTAVETHSRVQPVDPQVWSEFERRITYERVNFDTPADFERLSRRLNEIDIDAGTHGNMLFYLATQESAFPVIVHQLGRVGLDHEVHEGGWRRVVIEKPFGHDLDSAIRLKREVGKVFRETQVFRIDHYLGKETVRNLLVFRFGNGIFEPLWNRRYVDHVQITVAESLGLDSRGAFYEETGASRDVLQNHLLQLMTLVAMEPPATFSAEALRDEKIKVLRAVGPMSRDETARNVVRGQYGPGWIGESEVRGYRQESEVDPESETETFVAARLEIDDWRWAGVPFYLRTGKRLPQRTTEIAVQFRTAPALLFAGTSTMPPEPNVLTLRIQPDAGISLRFAAKVPGAEMQIRSVKMDFFYGTAFTASGPDDYARLLLDCMRGDQTLFARRDEVEQAWTLATPILEYWARQPRPQFPNYEAGTWGPPEADALIQRDGRRWRRL